MVSVLFHLPGALATEAVPSADEKTMTQADQKGQGKVTTSVFTTSIKDGKPADKLKAFENTVRTVYFFTELEGLKGKTVTHRWKYAGRVMATASIDVNSDPQPAWSSNKLEPNWTGFWVVEVVDTDGQVIAVNSFTYNHPKNLQMDPAANKAGEEPEGGWGGGGGWGPGPRW